MRYIVYRNKIKVLTLLLLGICFGQSFAQMEIKRHTINNGGGTMSGGNFSMNSSIGQVDASNIKSGGNFTLMPGFWHQNTTPSIIFKNGFE